MSDTKNNPPLTGLELLRAPFPAHQISKLPKPTRNQTDALKANRSLGIRCKLCGQWHHKDVVHIDYVGHAALTDRLLDCDPLWNWKPMAFDERGLPALDQNSGMWIALTVCGHTRLGYGDAPGKRGGDAMKEVIGDALRNAAMRFGAALDLWHKGELHVDDDAGDAVQEEPAPKETQDAPDFNENPADTRDSMKAAIHRQTTEADLTNLFAEPAFKADYAKLPEPMQNEIRAARREHLNTINGGANG